MVALPLHSSFYVMASEGNAVSYVICVSSGMTFMVRDRVFSGSHQKPCEKNFFCSVLLMMLLVTTVAQSTRFSHVQHVLFYVPCKEHRAMLCWAGFWSLHCSMVSVYGVCQTRTVAAEASLHTSAKCLAY